MGKGSRQMQGCDDLSRPIGVSADGHFLTQPGGAPFFWLGDTASQLFNRLDREETEVYLEDRARKGFNVIHVLATGRIYDDGVNSRNRFGDTPFQDSDPLRPNRRYFEHVDWVIARAADYGIRMAMLPVWGAINIAGTAKDRIIGLHNAEPYAQWLGERFKGRGIAWVLGGDVCPVSFRNIQPVETDGGFEWIVDRTLVDYRPVYDALAKGLLAGDGEDAFITYHPTSYSPPGAALPRTSLFLSDRRWLCMNMLQTGHAPLEFNNEGGSHLPGIGFKWNPEANYIAVGTEYSSRPVRPVIDGETHFEDHPKGNPVNGSTWNALEVRNAAYHALLAGAAGHTYGHFNIWDFPTQGDPTNTRAFAADKRVDWQMAIKAEGAGQMRFAKSLLLSRPYFSRIPDPGLVVGGAGTGFEHIGSARDKDGSYAIVYAPSGRPLTLDLKKISGPSATAWWFNPVDGEATRIPGRFPTDGAHGFVPPSTGQDWVLVLDASDRGFGPPGEPA